MFLLVIDQNLSGCPRSGSLPARAVWIYWTWRPGGCLPVCFYSNILIWSGLKFSSSLVCLSIALSLSFSLSLASLVVLPGHYQEGMNGALVSGFVALFLNVNHLDRFTSITTSRTYSSLNTDFSFLKELQKWMLTFWHLVFSAPYSLLTDQMSVEGHPSTIGFV